MNHQPKLAFDCDPGKPGSGRVWVYDLQPDLAACLHRHVRSGSGLQSLLRVTVAESEVPGGEDLPDVLGRCQILEAGLQFIPFFPFERGMKYRAVFDPGPLGASLIPEPSTLEFQIPPEQPISELPGVTHVYPSCDHLPENLLRFYVYFSNSMQRGRSLEEIALLDSEERPVADALYRAPVELWDRSMQRLTVLMDPGRLKRWVGPNVELGPPLKVGQEYILEIGSGMIDLHGRPLRQRFRKYFLVGDPVRGPISVEDWKIFPPVKGGRQAIALTFPGPLDRALIFQTITIESKDGLAMDGRVEVDRCETRWRFIPASPWRAGPYSIRVGSGLEDLCGNSIAGAFDRPLRREADLVKETNCASLGFQLF